MKKSTDRLPFDPPFRVVSDYKCGTDAHIMDSSDNVIIASSEWKTDEWLRHSEAMHIICDALNEKFALETQPQSSTNTNNNHEKNNKRSC